MSSASVRTRTTLTPAASSESGRSPAARISRPIRRPAHDPGDDATRTRPDVDRPAAGEKTLGRGSGCPRARGSRSRRPVGHARIRTARTRLGVQDARRALGREHDADADDDLVHAQADAEDDHDRATPSAPARPPPSRPSHRSPVASAAMKPAKAPVSIMPSSPTLRTPPARRRSRPGSRTAAARRRRCRS